MIVLYIIIGVVIGALAVYVWLQRQLADLRVKYEVSERELHLQKEQNEKDLQQQQEYFVKEQEQQKQQLEKERELQKQQLEKERELQKQQLEKERELQREQFHNLALRLLKEASEQLESNNKESMETLTRPINENFEQLQQAIKESDKEQARTAASLNERLRQVGEQADKMDRTATKLTNALRGDSKQAGDWGELVLQELLDAQGFRKGIDYDVQDTITDSEGKVVLNEESRQRMRPDVVLHYPDQQDVVIDAKVSIKAYYEYVNEQNEVIKRQLLDRHVQSIRSHVKELVAKDYSSYIQPPRNAIDFVIMYVPNEAALQIALAREPRLWQEAFDQKVFISSTQNLFAILRMIQIAWRQHRQTENQQRIVMLAEQLLSRVGLFTERIAKLGKDIQLLHGDYEDMQKSLNGRLSIVQKANEMKKLGVKEDNKHPLPSDLEEEQ